MLSKNIGSYQEGTQQYILGIYWDHRTATVFTLTEHFCALVRSFVSYCITSARWSQLYKNAMKINPGSPSAKVRHATGVELTVLLPQHLRPGMSLVENLPDLGDWPAVSAFANVHSGSALCLHNSYRHSFFHSSSQELSILADHWSSFLVVKNVWYIQWNIDLACQGSILKLLTSPFTKNSFREAVK